jgi:hypothetical protein
LLATGTFTLTDGTVRTLGDAALAYKPSQAMGSAPGGVALEVHRDRVAPWSSEQELVQGQETMAEFGSALRAGLDRNLMRLDSSGLFFDLPGGVNPFDHFAAKGMAERSSKQTVEPVLRRQDIPVVQVEDADAANAHMISPAEIGSTDQLRIALMVQEISTFGPSGSEADRHRVRDWAGVRFDLYSS